MDRHSKSRRVTVCFISILLAAVFISACEKKVVEPPERIRAVADAGADCFTIGTAALEGAFSPRKGSLASQLGDILEACVI